ncbi:DUF3568 family protein [Planctomycetota bacterium]
MMRIKQVLLTITFAGLALLGQGCVVAAVGLGAAGTIAYVRGDLEAVESETLEDVYEATLQAVEELDLRLISKSQDALSATVNTRDAQDKKIKITLKTTAQRTTKLSIRIGMFGSETKSRLIYQQIREKLRLEQEESVQEESELKASVQEESED